MVGTSQAGNDKTRPLHADEGRTAQFGMNNGDNTDMPMPALDPDQQRGGP